MTTQQPEALRLADEVDEVARTYPDMAEVSAELRRQHAEIESLQATIEIMVEEHADELMVAHLDGRSQAAQQPAPSAAVASKAVLAAIRAARAPADSVTASSWASHEKELEDALRERDESDEFIDTLLDEVLGADRAEWSSAYGRADALNDVQERMTTLHKPTVDKAWGRFQVAMAADSVLEDAARWQTFIALPYATRAEWASNLSLAPVLTQWVDTARKQGENHD